MNESNITKNTKSRAHGLKNGISSVNFDALISSGLSAHTFKKIYMVKRLNVITTPTQVMNHPSSPSDRKRFNLS